MKTDIIWKIAGEAGFGIMSAGTMMAKALMRKGYSVIASNEYPSLIRGGHNVITVRIRTTVITALKKPVDILVALNKETVDLHKDELSESEIVLFDPHDYQWKERELPKGVKALAIPLTEIVGIAGGEAIMRNTVAIAATFALIGVDFSSLADVIHDQFAGKGTSVVEENEKAARAGYEYIVKQYKEEREEFRLDKATNTTPHILLNASEAVGLGALSGGMKFAAIYPMTPINALITFFTDHSKEAGIVYKQPEDEIAGVNMAIGASLAGARSMVATSGGGFALMEEGISLAGIMETPLVIDLGMRPGPATGMPTWTEQGELGMVIHAGHGEFPRIVFAPGGPDECYTLTKEAFELADYYQTPVFILTDKYLNENQWSVPRDVFKAPQAELLQKEISLNGKMEFKRYDLAARDGISARSFPGTKYGEYIANSYEHDEKGFTTEDASVRTHMVTKRMKKMKAIIARAKDPDMYGDTNADVTFVSWGSTKGSVLEAMEILKAKSVKTKLIHFSWVYPLNGEKIAAILAKEKRLIDVECNATGQFASLLRENTGVEIKEKLLKFDGRPWYPEEIVNNLKFEIENTKRRI